jgi:type I restriction enzyme R subunit
MLDELGGLRGIMSVTILESVVEEAALEWFRGLGYQYRPGPDIACDGTRPERASYADVILSDRLWAALRALNPGIPGEALEDAFKKVTRSESPSLILSNRQFHRMLADGVDVEYRNKEGRVVGDKVWMIDFADPERNDWLAVNQFTVVEGQRTRRPDIVVFVNGLPLAVIELKNPADENATIKGAFNQFETYKSDIPSLFQYNELLVISDGTEARVGTISSGWEWFLPWRTIDGKNIAPKGTPELEVLIKGMFDGQRFLDIIRHFILFEVDETKVIKKVAAYHQYHAVNAAVEATLKATSPSGDKRVGVVWHTQGAGKSLTMVFYAGKIILQPEMENPTLVLLTDRNDLDDQLFDNFVVAQDLLRQKPIQAETREHLRELLKVASGGIIFTTIQKFLPENGERFPLLSNRRNIVVIADEAHRSQYDFIDGLARNMRDALPEASFIGFTGTPIEKADRSTPAVFGNYISIYDIQQAVVDGATVRIFYESRLAKLELKEEERPHIDPEFEEVTEGEEETVRQRLKTKWARLEAMVGTEKRVGLIAKDIIDHFDQRLQVMDGKGMIVCMSRRICVDLYDAIIKLRPSWHSDDDSKGFIKVIMTGSASDPPSYQPHVRNKDRREFIKKRMKDPADPLKLVIVRDMWLTGFDAPCLHTMYIDKPMRGHGLMQAIARVNRVFKDKPGGLVVDYLGIADELKKALAEYTEGSRGETGIPQEEAVAIMLEKYEVVSAMFHGFDYSRFFTGTPAERISIIPATIEHILVQPSGKERLLQVVTELSRAFALAVPHEKALEIKDEVGFFQAVRSAIAKNTRVPGKTQEELDSAIRQIVSKAIVSDKVIDIFSAAGLKKPDISILSDEFLSEVQKMPHRNLALELLHKLLSDEIRSRSRKNLIQSRSFAEMLEKTIRRYQNRTIEATQVILELIELAGQMRDARSRGEKLGLSEDEEAFYDALEVNDSAVKVLGDEVLKTLARKLVETVRRNATIDWTVRESARAKLRTMVRRLLRKYGYPPDKQEKATLTVLEQAESLGRDWSG